MQLLFKSWLAVVCLGLAGAAYGEEDPQVTDVGFCAPDGVALGGFDAVSYFTDDGPQPGGNAHEERVDGLIYRFASAENLEAFRGDPQKYLPKYRGWCSATLAMGRLACPDFTNFKIENGRLLLFERIGFSNGLDMWNLDPATNARNADRNFKALVERAAGK